MLYSFTSMEQNFDHTSIATIQNHYKNLSSIEDHLFNKDSWVSKYLFDNFKITDWSFHFLTSSFIDWHSIIDIKKSLRPFNFIKPKVTIAIIEILHQSYYNSSFSFDIMELKKFFRFDFDTSFVKILSYSTN